MGTHSCRVKTLEAHLYDHWPPFSHQSCLDKCITVSLKAYLLLLFRLEDRLPLCYSFRIHCYILLVSLVRLI